MSTRWFSVIILIASFVSVVHADHLTLSSGKVYEGEILQEGDSSITFRLDHGVITVPRSAVTSIDRSPPAPVVKPVAPIQATAKRVSQRIPNWEVVTSTLAKQSWATNLKQIPSTVVDKGAMRFVPYSSYRCGEDYEVNVYGDPDAPACVEIGVYRRLLRDDSAKSRCVEFIAAILPDTGDAAIVKALRRSKDLAVRDGVTFEITPDTDEDAYGGWWVSVYSQKALDTSRATDEELKHITVAKSGTDRPEAAAIATKSSQARSISAPTTQTDGTSTADNSSWNSSDLASSRSTGTSSNSGRVYVRGYYRKNGTYVAPHTRSAPRR